MERFIANYYGDMGIYLYLIPIVAIFSFALALIFNRSKTFAQTHLSVCFLTLGLGMTFSFLYDRYGVHDHSEILRFVNLITTCFAAACAHFYFIALMQPHRLTKRFITIYIGGILFFGSLLVCAQYVFDILEPIRTWKEVVIHIHSPHIIVLLIAIGCVIGLEGYIIADVLRMYFRHRRFIRNMYSYDERISLRWILGCIFLFFLFAIADLGWNIDSSIGMKITFNISSMFIIPTLFLLGFRQGETPVEPPASISNSEIIPEAEYISTIEPLPRHVQIKEALLEYFRNESPYLNPELSLHDVARQINTNTTYLSRLINREYNINFYGFVNKYRIEYAIMLMQQNKGKLTGDQLFASSGFKSRSSFYKQFRERTGMTPQEFLNRKVDP